MREIKFRVWDSERKQMYHLSQNRFSFGLFEGHRAVSWEDVFAEKHEELIPLQYTGLKDKNGREIYEGDIAKHKHKFGGGLGQVKYIVPHFGLRDLHEPAVSTDFEWTDFEEFEIIGNIYENPELIHGT